MYEDKMIVCSDCDQEFVHSAEDQERYASRGFEHEPKRCRECREKRKASSPQGGGGGGGGRPHRSGGGGGHRGNRDFGDRPPREFHDAVCSACGQSTTVPFKPVEGRPVYCRDCFRSRS